MKNKCVETIITIEFAEISGEMTDEEMKNFDERIPEFKEEIKTNLERIIRSYVCAYPDFMNVKIQTFLHD